MKVRYPRLEMYLNHGKNRERIIRGCGILPDKFDRIASGEELPDIPLLRKMAWSIGKSIDFLLTQERKLG